MVTPEREIEILAGDTSAEAAYLESRLYEFNVETTGISDGELLAAVVRGDEGEIIAGASGHTWGGHCEIKQLWVSEPYRRCGLGSRLMATVESEAVRRGCGQIVVATHSFQAPRFYEKLGFARIAEIPDYPRGRQYFFYRKLLIEQA